MLKIASFQVEHMSAGCVTDEAQPRFSWYAESDRGDNEITDAVLTVGNWQSRRREQSVVRYSGPALTPMQAYKAQLHVRDRYGEEAEAEIEFETGRMGTPFAASWITDGSYRFTEKKVSPRPMLFRKRTVLAGDPQKIARARVYVTALGLYELSIDGRKVGEDYLTPGFTSYRNEMQYQVYDVTDRLSQPGQKSDQAQDTREIALEATVTGGWAVGSYTYFRRNRVYGDKQAFLCELRITYIDGTEQIIGTDKSWKVTTEGPLKEADIYDGEVYDASIDPLSVPMHAAAEVDPEDLNFTKKPNLLASYGAPVRTHETMKPAAVFTAPSGERIYDMGQNFTGILRAKMRGRAGQKITFRHAELLMDGELCYAPLRTAKQRLEYICRDGEQEYSPRFCYMGFRYIGVTGIEEKDLELSALALYSDVGDNGSFECSGEMLNKLQKAICWGAKSNFTDIPTDCPQRDERLGWTGDIALFAPTAAFNFDMSRFFDKWLLDVKSEQGRGGGIPMIVPSVKIYNQVEMTLTHAVDHWGDCCIWVPWAEYMVRGDKNLLRRMYPTMRRYMQACIHWAELGSFGKNKRVWSAGHHYGDWCAPDTGFKGWMKRGKYTATACLARSAGTMSKIARILGKDADAEKFDRLKEETADAYRSVLMDQDCRPKDEFQTAYVLPLHYGLLRGEDRKKAAANLVRLVRKNGWHIGTGFPGTPYILFALADNGYEEDAYKMLLTDTCPSWLYEIKAGGTTIWERWDALCEDGSLNKGKDGDNVDMVSLNHYAAGAVGDFLYRRVAGIEPVEAGYKRFRIRPVVGGGLTSASAKVVTAYGPASVMWEIVPCGESDSEEAGGASLSKGGQFRLTAQVPLGTKCEVILPDGTAETVGSGEHRFVCPYTTRRPTLV